MKQLNIFHFKAFFSEERLPQGNNQVFHSYVQATSAKLTPQENIEAMQKMEEENFAIAKKKGFVGILTTNISPLTQQLSTSIYGYRTLVDCQVNKYCRPDGSRPFANAPDSQKVLLQWKNINEFSG